MDAIDPQLIDARRQAGIPYSTIAAELGGTKDSIRGIHKRWQASQIDTVLTYPLPHVVTNAGPDGGTDGPLPPIRSAGFIAPTASLNFGFYDLESTALNGSFGRLHTAACGHTDGTEWSARIDGAAFQNKREKSDDKRLAVAVRDHLESHDIIFSWNGRRGQNPKGRGGFDVPMLNARLVPDRILKSDNRTHIDLLPVARKHLQLHSYRLAAVQEFLELQEEKSAITPRVWRLALDHDKEALDYILDHNLRDVRVLQEVFWQFLRAGLLSIGVTVARS